MSTRSFIGNVLKVMSAVLYMCSCWAGNGSNSSLQFLMSEGKSIWLSSEDGANIQLIDFKDHNGIILDMDYHLAKNKVFYTMIALHSTALGSIQVTGILRKPHGRRRRHITRLGNWNPISLSVDYVADKLYVIDSVRSEVNVFDLEGQYRNIIFNNLVNPTDTVLDPQAGLMFIADDSGIMRASMDGKLFFNQFSCISCYLSIAIDPTAQKIVWHRSTGEIQSSDYFGESIVDISKSQIIYGLNVFENHIYYRQGQRGIAKSALESKSVSIILEYKQFENSELNILKLVHPSLQNTNVTNPCSVDNNECEHLCVLTPGSEDVELGRRCLCDIGNVISEDLKTCNIIQEYVMFEQNSVIYARTLDPKATYRDFAEHPISASFEVYNFDYDPSHRTFFATSALCHANEIFWYEFPSFGEKVLSEFGFSNGTSCILIALDWITQNLYYISEKEQNLEVLNVRKGSFSTEHYRKTLLRNIQNTKLIVAHPVRGYVFFSQWNETQIEIMRLNTDGLNLTTVAHWPADDSNVNLTIDFSEDRIYWFTQVITLEMKTNITYSNVTFLHADIDGKDQQQFDSSFDCNPSSLAVFDKYLYLSCGHSIWRLNKLNGQDKKIIVNNLKYPVRNLKVFTLFKKHEDHPCFNNNGACDKFCFGVPDEIGPILKKSCSDA